MILLKTYFKHTALFTLLFLISISIHSQTKAKDGKEFPAPKDIKNLLFYVQRTNNINTLIYQLNYTDKNELNEKEPIKIYWKNYNTDGTTESLNAIQKKYAYGIETHVLDSAKKSFYFNFVSYKKKQIFLIKSPIDNKYEAFATINNKLMTVTRIYIHIEGGAFWTPKIKYIDVFGKLPTKNEEVVERVIP
jgi:hypothetical protein